MLHLVDRIGISILSHRLALCAILCKNPEANADEVLVTTEDEREEDDILFGTGREDRDEVEDDGILLLVCIERDSARLVELLLSKEKHMYVPTIYI